MATPSDTLQSLAQRRLWSLSNSIQKLKPHAALRKGLSTQPPQYTQKPQLSIFAAILQFQPLPTSQYLLHQTTLHLLTDGTHSKTAKALPGKAIGKPPLKHAPAQNRSTHTSYRRRQPSANAGIQQAPTSCTRTNTPFPSLRKGCSFGRLPQIQHTHPSAC